MWNTPRKYPPAPDSRTWFDMLFVGLGFALAFEYGKGIQCKGFLLVLTREDIDGCEEADAAAYLPCDVL